MMNDDREGYLSVLSTRNVLSIGNTAKTTDKGTVAYATGTAIRENSSEQVLFYFQPKEAGTWNLWVCTDEEGKNVIGQSTVEIIAAPTGEAKLEASNLKLTEGTTTTYTLTLDSDGNITAITEATA